MYFRMFELHTEVNGLLMTVKNLEVLRGMCLVIHEQAFGPWLDLVNHPKASSVAAPLELHHFSLALRELPLKLH